MANMSFNAYRENKILEKISRFTVISDSADAIVCVISKGGTLVSQSKISKG